jgi:hypothetical protein
MDYLPRYPTCLLADQEGCQAGGVGIGRVDGDAFIRGLDFLMSLVREQGLSPGRAMAIQSVWADWTWVGT